MSLDLWSISFALAFAALWASKSQYFSK